jgi:hypothetical protein
MKLYSVYSITIDNDTPEHYMSHRHEVLINVYDSYELAVAKVDQLYVDSIEQSSINSPFEITAEIRENILITSNNEVNKLISNHNSYNNDDNNWK